MGFDLDCRVASLLAMMKGVASLLAMTKGVASLLATTKAVYFRYHVNCNEGVALTFATDGEGRERRMGKKGLVLDG